MRKTQITQLTRRNFAIGLPLLSVLPWLPINARATPWKFSRAIMGTQVDVIVVPEEKIGAEKTLAAAVETAFAEMQRLERLMGRYDPHSEVNRLKQMAGKSPIHVAPEVMSVLLNAKRLHRSCAGAFDPTIGSLNGWSFVPGKLNMPEPEEIAQSLPLVNMDAVRLDESTGTAYLERQGMALDLGGIAKLPILQAGLDVLEQHGISRALINGGGDVLTLGTSAHGQPWRVGVRSPQEPSKMLGIVALQGRHVLASSGDYERVFFKNGRRLHHILDPKNGWPTQQVHGVALLGQRIEEINGWGTALMVQGAAWAKAWSHQHPEIGVLVSSQGEKTGHQTSWMR